MSLPETTKVTKLEGMLISLPLGMQRFDYTITFCVAKNPKHKGLACKVSRKEDDIAKSK